jgi:glycosyltransferase involved in cell wall biosynthesis
MADDATEARVHMVEFGGRGGVFQHALGLASALSGAGVAVTLHTATDAELEVETLELCPCVKWNRSLPDGLRQATTAARFLAFTVPHVVRSSAGSDLVHVQGLFHPALTTALLAALRAGRRRVAFSPHNTFARSGSGLDLAVMRWSARRAHVVFAFSSADAQVMSGWGVDSAVVELISYLPEPDPLRIARWRDRYGRAPVALLAGNVRPDKRPAMFVEAVAAVPGVRPVVVGEDRGAGAACTEAARRVDVDLLRIDDYLPLEDFVAAIAAADVVVAPHAVASASSSIAVARALGVRTVAARVGGLGEQAMVVAESETLAGFADAIGKALGQPPPEPALDADSVVGATLAAYATAGWRS